MIASQPPLHIKREGVRLAGAAFVDAAGRRVRWGTLAREIEQGCTFFWSRKGRQRPLECSKRELFA